LYCAEGVGIVVRTDSQSPGVTIDVQLQGFKVITEQRGDVRGVSRRFLDLECLEVFNSSAITVRISLLPVPIGIVIHYQRVIARATVYGRFVFPRVIACSPVVMQVQRIVATTEVYRPFISTRRRTSGIDKRIQMHVAVKTRGIEIRTFGTEIQGL